MSNIIGYIMLGILAIIIVAGIKSEVGQWKTTIITILLTLLAASWVIISAFLITGGLK